jgi:hypothetical protein
MRVLILHHLEPMWRDGYKRCGTTFERLQEKVVDFLQENVFDKIILTRFEDTDICTSEGYSFEFADKVNDVRDYGYGWPAEALEDAPDRFCLGGNHSEAVLIDDWMLPLKKAARVVIAGAFDGECIEDLEIALAHLGIDFEREESLIIGL